MDLLEYFSFVFGACVFEGRTVWAILSCRFGELKPAGGMRGPYACICLLECKAMYRQSARAKYGEAYKQLQRAVSLARDAMDPQEIRMVAMAADWVHLKLLLYAIGSGTIGPENVRSLHVQWRNHLRSFGAHLGASNPCFARSAVSCLCFHHPSNCLSLTVARDLELKAIHGLQS
jgi:hypothetical protein